VFFLQSEQGFLCCVEGEWEQVSETCAAWNKGDAWIENQEMPQFPAAETQAHFVKHQSSASRSVAATSQHFSEADTDIFRKKKPK